MTASRAATTTATMATTKQRRHALKRERGGKGGSPWGIRKKEGRCGSERERKEERKKRVEERGGLGSEEMNNTAGAQWRRRITRRARSLSIRKPPAQRSNHASEVLIPAKDPPSPGQ
ncbi:hypothetical protein GQ53DRAFT_16572 [Thozetella sp. PMI_491]|nr:hypothetical protein GQ53DRAFT_16572 [Thozetella sp. PMI_491]